ncbi:hypothetical protein JOS77_11555 [Chromobacterium haemolyticum]|nr:hypothetical protein JOS77_11555 [Chromobacterium haemolyticum]
MFTRTKHGANRLAEKLDKTGIPAAAIHGNKSQNARTRALADFKSGELQVLVATDIAARGLDIDQLPQVVNFELPNVPEDYVHRIGRTGRAGSKGEAVSLVCVDEFNFLKDIEKLTKQSIERFSVPGFEADLSVKPEPIPMGGGNRRGQPQRQGGGGKPRHQPDSKPTGHGHRSPASKPRQGQGQAKNATNGQPGQRSSQGQGQGQRSKPAASRPSSALFSPPKGR